jgi:hypothetical protein
MSQLAESWVKTEALLKGALEQLEGRENAAHYAISRRLEGSHEEATLFLEHNEFELAWEALAAVGKRERPPYTFWRYLLEAAETMNLSQQKVDTSLRDIFRAPERIAPAFTRPVRVYGGVAPDPAQIQQLQHIFGRRGMQDVSVMPGTRAFSDDYVWSLVIETDAQAFLNWFFGNPKHSMRRFVRAIRKIGDTEAVQHTTIKLRDEQSRAEAVLHSAETFDIPEAGYRKLVEADWLPLYKRGVRLVYDQGEQQWVNVDASARALA